MPPRRSGRYSLPTPAHSTKSAESPSIASTPGTSTPSVVKNSKSRQPGLPTPNSLTDDDEVEVDMKEAFHEDEDEKITVKPPGRKRKSEVNEDEALFSSSNLAMQNKRVQLDSVTIPTRSKLSTEKTTSADNLTLGSPASKRDGRSSSGMLKSEPADEDANDGDIKPTRRVTGKSAGKTAGQPFNIGKFSSVTKADLTSLALEEQDLKPSSSKSRQSLGKRAGKSRMLTPESPDKLDILSQDEKPFAFAETAGEDYAMDSDEESRQLKSAISESISASRLQSSAVSSTSTSEKGKGRGRGAKVETGKATRTSGLPARAASARSAQKRAAATKKSGPSAFDALSPPSTDSDSGSAFTDPEASESEESEAAESSDLSDASEDAFELSSSAKGSGAKGRAQAKAKGKAKAKAPPRAKAIAAKIYGKGKRASNGDAVKLETDTPDMTGTSTPVNDDTELNSNVDELSGAGDEADWEELQERLQEADERMSTIRQQENKMKKALGRKLTNGERNIIRLVYHHPELDNIWGDLENKVKPIKPVTMEAHPSLKLKLLPFQKESLHWMKKQEEGVWKGGMLADEMGMGKTIQTIALLLSEPRRKPSLVVAPVVALMQWKHEIETHAEGFSVCLWHGTTRLKASELMKYDVVLSSYGTLEAAFRRQQRGFKRGDRFITEKSPMHSFEWFRVVLDEAHNIKERSTNAAKAAFALQAKYRWCLSGTPLQNRVGELYSLVRFLGAEPFSNYFCKKCDCKTLHWQFSDKRHCDTCGHKPMDHVCFWNTEILTPIAKYGIETGGPGHTAFKKLKVLLDRMMLRRTKLERADDLGLPPRTIVVRRDYFSPEEKELYASLFSTAKRQFSTYIGAGTVLNNYSNIFALITRMRQMACHPDLVLRSKNSKLIEDADEGTVCRICNDSAEDAILSGCKHVFDRECIRQYLEVQQLRGHRPECPVCHIEISIDLEAEAIDLTEGNKKARQGILSRLNLDNWRSSTKLEALVEELEKLRRQDCTIKSLVFSQFVSFLDLIAFRLQRAGFNVCRLEGGMTPQQRDATIQHFMKNPHVSVFLISLKAGGVALNLTEASMVFMMDSWWNPSVEYQAMDRIHRLGQKRPVKVVKLVVEDSIEDQIVQLQHKKLAMTEAALSTDPDAALGKLTVEDLGFLFKM